MTAAVRSSAALSARGTTLARPCKYDRTAALAEAVGTVAADAATGVLIGAGLDPIRLA